MGRKQVSARVTDYRIQSDGDVWFEMNKGRSDGVRQGWRGFIKSGRLVVAGSSFIVDEVSRKTCTSELTRGNSTDIMNDNHKGEIILTAEPYVGRRSKPFKARLLSLQTRSTPAYSQGSSAIAVRISGGRYHGITRDWKVALLDSRGRELVDGMKTRINLASTEALFFGVTVDQVNASKKVLFKPPRSRSRR